MHTYSGNCYVYTLITPEISAQKEDQGTNLKGELLRAKRKLVVPDSPLVTKEPTFEFKFKGIKVEKSFKIIKDELLGILPEVAQIV